MDLGGVHAESYREDGKMEAEDRRLVNTTEEEPRQGTEEAPRQGTEEASPGRGGKRRGGKQGRETG